MNGASKGRNDPREFPIGRSKPLPSPASPMRPMEESQRPGDDAVTEPCWPALPLASWQDTCETLHMWAQMVGKVRLVLTPSANHWWHVPLYVSARGLTTSAIPYRGGAFELEFDFLLHQLALRTVDGREQTLPLTARPVADFYREFMNMLREAGVEV